MADLELVDALTDTPPQTETEIKRDFISSLEAEPYDDVIGEKCDKTDYVPLLDDDEANGSSNKHSSEGSHPSVLENGEHNTGDVNVSDPFGTTGDEDVLADLLLPPQVQICPAFTAQLPDSSARFDEGWLTDSYSKSVDTDTQSADASEKTTATYGETPSDDSANLPFQVQQSDPNSHIWQPTAEEQIALSFHNTPEHEGLQLKSEESPFDTALSTESQLLPGFATSYLEEPDTDLLKPDFYNQGITSAYIENPDSTTENYVHDSLNNLAVAEDRVDEAASIFQSVESGQPKGDIEPEQVTPTSQTSIEPPRSPATQFSAEFPLRPVELIQENSLVEQFPAEIDAEPLASIELVQDEACPVSLAALNQETGSTAFPAEFVQEAETLTTPIALVQEAEAPTSPIALVQGVEVLASPVDLIQGTEVPASPVALLQETEIPASPVDLVQGVEVPASPVALLQETEILASPVDLVQGVEVPASPVDLVQGVEVPASPVDLVQGVEIPASPIDLVQGVKVPASPVDLLQGVEVPASPIDLVQEAEVSASPIALVQESEVPVPPITLVHELQAPASPIALVPQLESPAEALTSSVILGDQPPEGPPEQFNTLLGRNDLQHPGEQVPLKQNSCKTSDRRLCRAKTALAPVSDTFLEFGSSSLNSPPSHPGYTESLTSRAKALHKKAHDMMESRKEAARDVGDPEGIQTFIKKKKKKTKPRKSFVPKELEIGEEDAFTKTGSEPFYTSAGQMGHMETFTRQDHLFEQPLNSAANGTVPARNLTVAENTLEYSEREGDLTLFSQEKITPAPQKIDSLSIKHFETPPDEQEDKSLFDQQPSLMGESRKPDAPIETIFGTADTEVTKCPYLHPEILRSASDKALSKKDESCLEKTQSVNKHLADSFLGAAAETLKWDKPKKRDKRAGNNSHGGQMKDPKHRPKGLDSLESDAQARSFSVALPLNPEREALQEEKHSPLVIPLDELQRCRKRDHKLKSNNVNKNLYSDTTDPPMNFGHGLHFMNVSSDLLASEEKMAELENDLHSKAFHERDKVSNAAPLPVSHQLSTAFGEGIPKEDIPCMPLTLTDTVVGLVLGSIEPKLDLTVAENEPVTVPKDTAPVLKTDQVLGRKESTIDTKPGTVDDGKGPEQKSKPLKDLFCKESLLENKSETCLIGKELIPESKPGIVLSSKERVPESKPCTVLGSKEPVPESKPGIVLGRKEPVPESKPDIDLGRKEPVPESKPGIVLGSKEPVPESKPGIVLGSKEPVPESKPGIVLGSKEPVSESKPGIVLGSKELVSESKPGIVLGSKEPVSESKPGIVLGSKEPVPESKPGIVLGSKEPVPESKASGTVLGSKEPVPESKPGIVLGSKEPVSESKPGTVLGSKEPVQESKPGIVLGSKKPVPESKPCIVLGSKEPVPESKPDIVLGRKEPVPESKPGIVLGSKELVSESKPGIVLGSKEPVPESKPGIVLGSKEPVPESKASGTVLGSKEPVSESKPGIVLGSKKPVPESKPGIVLGSKKPVPESKPCIVLGSKEPVPENKPVTNFECKVSSPEMKPSTFINKELVEEYKSCTESSGKEPLPEGKLDKVLGLGPKASENQPHTESKPAAVLGGKQSTPKSVIIPESKGLTPENKCNTVQDSNEPVPEDKPDKVLALKGPTAENKPCKVLGDKGTLPERKSSTVLDNKVFAPEWKRLQEKKTAESLNDKVLDVEKNKPVKDCKVPILENVPHTVLDNKEPFLASKPASGSVLEIQPSSVLESELFPDKSFSSPAMVSQSETIVQASQLLSSKKVQNDGNVAFDGQLKSKRGKVKSKPNGAKSLHDAGDRGLEIFASYQLPNDQLQEASFSNSKKTERGSLKRPHSSEKNKSSVLTEAGPFSSKDLTRNDHVEDSTSDPVVPLLPLLDVTTKEQEVKELQGLDPVEADFSSPPCNVKSDQPERQTMHFPSFLKDPSDDVLMPTVVMLQGEMELKSSKVDPLNITLEPSLNLASHLAKSLEAEVHGSENLVLEEKLSGLPMPTAEERRECHSLAQNLPEKLQFEVSGPSGLLDYNFNVQEGSFDFTTPKADGLSEAPANEEFPANVANLSKDHFLNVPENDTKYLRLEEGCDATEHETFPAASKAMVTNDASKAKTKISSHLKEKHPLMEKAPQKNGKVEEKTKADLKGYMRPTKARGATSATPPLSRSAGLATVKPKQPKDPRLRPEKGALHYASSGMEFSGKAWLHAPQQWHEVWLFLLLPLLLVWYTNINGIQVELYSNLIAGTGKSCRQLLQRIVILHLYWRIQFLGLVHML